jgi:hypothetical protein
MKQGRTGNRPTANDCFHAAECLGSDHFEYVHGTNPLFEPFVLILSRQHFLYCLFFIAACDISLMVYGNWFCRPKNHILQTHADIVALHNADDEWKSLTRSAKLAPGRSNVKLGSILKGLEGINER